MTHLILRIFEGKGDAVLPAEPIDALHLKLQSILGLELEDRNGRLVGRAKHRIIGSERDSSLVDFLEKVGRKLVVDGLYPFFVLALGRLVV